jgi:hypothetical protein
MYFSGMETCNGGGGGGGWAGAGVLHVAWDVSASPRVLIFFLSTPILAVLIGVSSLAS